MKGVNPKDDWKRALPRPGRPYVGKDRKRGQPERSSSIADLKNEQDRDADAEPTGEHAEDDDAAGIFAPEPPQIPFAAPPPAPAEIAPPTAEEAGRNERSPRQQGMGRWFVGVALCVLGTGYVAYQVLSDVPGSLPDPDAPPQPAFKGETIHKLPPDAAPPSSGLNVARPLAIEIPQLPAEDTAVAEEPPPAETAELPAAADTGPPIVPAAQAPAVFERPEATTVVAVDEPGDESAPAIAAPPSSEPEVIRDCPDCPELVVVPAGSFFMGSSAAEVGHQQHEAPQHEVAFLAPFAIGRFEVTFEEWDLCVREGGCRHRPRDEGWGRERMPALNVSWQDIAGEFLPWLARKSGKPYRLPSEAEWEYAVRASPGLALTAALGAAVAAGAACGFANAAAGVTPVAGASGSSAACGDTFANTAPVGSFKANSWGLHDLAGNVWEWVEDCWNDSYRAAPTDGSTWTTGDCDLRVVRGGSWSSDAEKLRFADRGWNRPDSRSPSIGFRVARNQ